MGGPPRLCPCAQSMMHDNAAARPRRRRMNCCGVAVRHSRGRAACCFAFLDEAMLQLIKKLGSVGRESSVLGDVHITCWNGPNYFFALFFFCLQVTQIRPFNVNGIFYIRTVSYNWFAIESFLYGEASAQAKFKETSCNQTVFEEIVSFDCMH